MKKCCICGSEIGVETHHVYHGTANRKVSEQNNFKVDLCYEHHRGTNGVHGKNGAKLSLQLKKMMQAEYEKDHSREEFIALIGRNYLEVT